MGGLLGLSPEWKEIWKHEGSYEGEISLSEVFGLQGNRATEIPHYNGRLKLEFDDPAPRLDDLTLRTTIQSSLFGLRSLELKAGQNTVHFYGQPMNEVAYGADGDLTSAAARGQNVSITFRYREISEAAKAE